MNKKLAIIALLALVVGGAIFLGWWFSRKRMLKAIREKWGPANPAALHESTFANDNLAALRWILEKGKPGWVRPHEAGWQYRTP